MKKFGQVSYVQSRVKLQVFLLWLDKTK